MIKIMALTLACFISASVFATSATCPPAAPTNTIDFCRTFRASAECYCTASGLPKGMCGNMNQLYNRMVGMFGSLKKACEFQRNTSAQACIDDWNCYLFGGTNSRGESCNTTGTACV